MHKATSVALALASAVFTTRSTAAPYGTDITVAPMLPNGGQVDVPNEPLFLVTTEGAPFSIARAYHTPDGGDRLLLLSGVSGEFRIIGFGVDGEPVQTGSGLLPARAWRDAEFVYTNNYPTLFLFDDRDGVIAQHAVGGFGNIDTTPTQTILAPELRGKSIYDAFAVGTQHRIFSLDPGTGAVTYGDLPWSGASLDDQHTYGWTDVDHATSGGTTLRVLYKGEGQPGIDTFTRGRMVVQSIGASGTGSTLYDEQDPVNPYTIVRTYPINDTTTGVIGYRRIGSPLETQLYRLDTDGASADLQLIGNDSDVPTDLDHIEFFRRGGVTYFVGIRYDVWVPEVSKMNGPRAQMFAECVDAQLAERTPGYQLTLHQTGEVLIDRAVGVRELQPSVLPMERDTPIDLGGVSKLFTTLTTLALGDTSVIDLLGDLASQIPGSGHHAWTSQRRPVDLMANSTGGDSFSASCDHHDGLAPYECQTFYSEAPPLLAECTPLDPSNPISVSCPIRDTDAHFGALRDLIEEATGVSNTGQLDGLTQSTWLSSVAIDGPSCRRRPTSSKLFARCQPGQTCVSHEGRPWTQVEMDDYLGDWSLDCAAQGWEASARDMVRVVEAAHGHQILTSQGTNRLFSEWPNPLGQDSSLGWDTLLPNGVKPNVAKAGASHDDETGAGSRAAIRMTSNDVIAALHINGGEGTPSALDVIDSALVPPGPDACLPVFSSVRQESVQAGDDGRDTFAILYANAEFVVTGGRIIDGHFGHLPRDGLELRSFRRTEEGELIQTDRFDFDQSADKIQSFIRLHHINGLRFVAATRTQKGAFQMHLCTSAATAS